MSIRQLRTARHPVDILKDTATRLDAGEQFTQPHHNTMLLKYFTSLALAGLAIAQTLTDVISRNPNLSTLGQLVAQYPSIASVLSNATNVTILAPTNAAFTSFLNQPGMNQSISADPNLVQAVLSYHVLQGVFRSTSITSTPAFARTLLMAGYYANVTGGQVVQAVNSGGTVTFTSGLLRQSRVSQADVTFNGGVVHVIDSVLTLPASPGATAAGANLTALAGALNTAGLVGTVNSLSVSVPRDDGWIPQEMWFG